jgi:hypothetical protein
MRFPFESDHTYTFAELRAFERELSARRQADQALSSAWRVPATTEMQQWLKRREETYAIKLLADHKGYRDEGTFRLRQYAFPGVDADINAEGERFDLQVTVADPIWGDAEHGGFDNRLMLEALNREGFVIGAGGFRRDGEKIVSDAPVRSPTERADACRKALVAALIRKAKKQSASRLLIHARGFSIHIVDAGFGPIVAEAVGEFERTSGQRVPYDAVYFVEQDEFAEA